MPVAQCRAIRDALPACAQPAAGSKGSLLLPDAQWAEIDGRRVVAVLLDGAIPLNEWTGAQPTAGQILGLAAHEHDRNPVWLCEVLRLERAAIACVVHCMLAQADAAVWYGPPTWHSVYDKATWDIGDTAPANYDVFGVLPKEAQGPPVIVGNEYVRISRIRAFVPPPYRRTGCWFTEAAIDAERR